MTVDLSYFIAEINKKYIIKSVKVYLKVTVAVVCEWLMNELDTSCEWGKYELFE